MNSFCEFDRFGRKMYGEEGADIEMMKKKNMFYSWQRDMENDGFEDFN